MPKKIQEIYRLGNIANWYYDEGDRCVEENNVPGALFWLFMGNLTSAEMEG